MLRRHDLSQVLDDPIHEYHVATNISWREESQVSLPSDTVAIVDEDRRCFHCDKPIDDRAAREVLVDDKSLQVCSARCAEVVAAINDAGLESFYTKRRRMAHSPATLDGDLLAHLNAYDSAALQQKFARHDTDGIHTASLLVEGVNCAGCVRLIESRLEKLPGVESIAVNAATSRAELRWDSARVNFSDVIREMYALGYAAYPFEPDRRQRLLANERRSLLKRLALAALFGMQIMMFTVAMYVGESSGMTQETQFFFRCVCILLAIPVLGYCARPFFQGAKRALSNRELGMDVPVSLALSLGFVASIWGTLSQGEVYFECLAMFTALLLASRYYECVQRCKATQQLDKAARIVPKLVNRMDESGACQSISLGELSVGEVVLVKPGAVVPIDGEVVAGLSAINEAVVTGESRPRKIQPGSLVLAGCVNIDSPLQVRASRAPQDSFMNVVSRLAAQAEATKPRLTIFANRIASWFILGVLIATALVALYWGLTDPSRMIATSIAVLVISCPCALALATPVAVAAASAALLRHGAAMVKPNVLESLAGAGAFVFDKTGTLTTGQLRLESVLVPAGWTRQRVLGIAASLSAFSEHHVAAALRRAGPTQVKPALDVRNVPGSGVLGTIDGTVYFLGSRRFLQDVAAIPPSAFPAPSEDARFNVTYLAEHGRRIAEFSFIDDLDPAASELVAALRGRDIDVAMLTGDDAAVAHAVAARLGITDVRAAMQPAAKLTELTQRQSAEQVTVVVGDGVNDAPMIAQGYVSVAVGKACDLTKHHADIVLLGDDLSALTHALRIARKTMRVIRQNIAWAIAYNATALPLAIAGVVSPWVAALGMSASSFVVVANAARINR